MALSDMAVRQARATGKAYTLGDIDGLSLALTDMGGRSWHFRYSWAGKQKRMSLGTYPEVGLREARTLRNQARLCLPRASIPSSIVSINSSSYGLPTSTHSKLFFFNGLSIVG